MTLRRLAAELEDVVKQVPDVAETAIIGGQRRVILAAIDPAKLAARNLSLAGIIPVLQQANRQYRAGEIYSGNHRGAHRERRLSALGRGGGGGGARRLGGQADLSARRGGTLRRRRRSRQLRVFRRGAAASGQIGDEENAVTITVAKRPGTNAISLAETILEKVDPVKGA